MHENKAPAPDDAEQPVEAGQEQRELEGPYLRAVSADLANGVRNAKPELAEYAFDACSGLKDDVKTIMEGREDRLVARNIDVSQKMFDSMSDLLGLDKKIFNLERMRAFAPKDNEPK